MLCPSVWVEKNVYNLLIIIVFQSIYYSQLKQFFIKMLACYCCVTLTLLIIAQDNADEDALIAKKGANKKIHNITSAMFGKASDSIWGCR